MIPVPEISIVLPTYNGEKFLERAVKSCTDQTFRDWELIAVDDGSTDETPSILRALAKRDPRIRALRHEKNRSLPAALNTGFREARGRLHTWTSDDNYYFPAALEHMKNFLAAHPEVDVVYADYEMRSEEGVLLRAVPADPPENLLFSNCVGSCFLYRKHVFSTLGGYDERLFGIEDFDFWMRAFARFKLAPLNKTLYVHTLHPDTLTTRLRGMGIRVLMEKAFRKNLPDMPASAAQRFFAFLNLAQLARDNGSWQGWLFMLRAIACKRGRIDSSEKKDLLQFLRGGDPDKWWRKMGAS